uniref:Cation/H+ exchanger transmembrane domain-containing protein n=1 Tax=Brassica campestris TaxID=3711 RepID=M4FHV4_BRACM
MKRDYDETKMKELEQISVTTYNITSNAMMITQVETVAQFGVIFLLFALGLEFSAAKLRVVRAVAIPGGLLQIFLFMCLSGITASLCGGKLTEGIFVGVEIFNGKKSISALHGQITVGTLILQDCAVGLLFALLPVLGGTSGVLQGMLSMAKSLAILIAFLAALFVLSRTWVPWFLKLMTSLSSQTNELYQLAAVAFCLLVAWVGMSLAQIGEFAFVLLSRASNLHLIESKLYLLLLGTTALSLVTTPFLLKLIPAVVHLGVLLRWFSPNSSTEVNQKHLCRPVSLCTPLAQTQLFDCLFSSLHVLTLSRFILKRFYPGFVLRFLKSGFHFELFSI